MRSTSMVECADAHVLRRLRKGVVYEVNQALALAVFTLAAMYLEKRSGSVQHAFDGVQAWLWLDL